MLEEWTEYCSSKDHFDRSDGRHRVALAKSLLLCADIGIVCESRSVYIPWLKRLFDEVRAVKTRACCAPV